MTCASRSNRCLVSSRDPALPALAGRPADQLDRRRAGEHPVARLPDLAHGALAQLLVEPIAPPHAGARDFAPQTVDDTRTDVRDDDCEHGLDQRVRDVLRSHRHHVPCLEKHEGEGRLSGVRRRYLRV